MIRIRIHHGQALLLFFTLTAAALLLPSSADARRADPLAGLDSNQRRVFQNYTRLFCQQFFRYGDDRFVLLPNYYTKRENSTGLTYEQVQEMMTVVVKEKRGAMVFEKRILPPPGEVIARAKMIPAMEVGHYGFINSVRISQILGEEEMVVTELMLIPRSELGYDRTEENKYRWELVDRQEQIVGKSYRLLGFSTRGLEAGVTYFGPQKKGMQVAVLSTDREYEFVLINYEKVERLKTTDFPEVLEYIQLSPLEFIDMVRQNREADVTAGDRNSLKTIYRRFYNRYRPAQVSAPPIIFPGSDPPPVVDEPKADPASKPASDPDTASAPPQDPATPIDDPTTPQVEDKPATEPTDRPGPREEEPREEEPVKDDWKLEDASTAPDKLDFFGIPLGDK